MSPFDDKSNDMFRKKMNHSSISIAGAQFTT